LAAKAAPELAEVLTLMACSHRSARIEMLEGLLAEDGYASAPWTDDVTTRIEGMRRAGEFDFSRPADLMLQNDDELIPAIQSILRSYGRLLEWWPAIARRARELADDGTHLGIQI
jgi:hypothetical protein